MLDSLSVHLMYMSTATKFIATETLNITPGFGLLYRPMLILVCINKIYTSLQQRNSLMHSVKRPSSKICEAPLIGYVDLYYSKIKISHKNFNFYLKYHS
jgi:hypothetical protein